MVRGMRLGCLAAGLGAGVVAQGQPVFELLGLLPGGVESQATGVSADGTLVVGTANTYGGARRAFLWSHEGGIQSLGTLPGHWQSWGSAVTADGRTIVGSSELTAGLGGRACRWVLGSGVQDLGAFPGQAHSGAAAVSATGSVIGGSGSVGTWYHAARWTGAGLVDLGTLPGGVYTTVTGVSADGAVMVGYGATGQPGEVHALRWTAAGGLHDLGVLPARTYSWAMGVSGDGSVVVGYAGGGENRPFRWSAARGMEALPGAGPTGYGEARTVNRRGTAIGGAYPAVIWTTRGGVLDIGAILGGLAVNLDGWTLTEITGFAEDGRTVVGNAVRNGLRQGWIVRLPAAYLCEANCDGSTTEPFLNVGDFICFLTRYTAGDPWANCDGSTAAPVLNVGDYACFLNRFFAGCP